jgi:hypothetical protein
MCEERVKGELIPIRFFLWGNASAKIIGRSPLASRLCRNTFKVRLTQLVSHVRERYT